MARLTWLTEHKYELGLDRGVLYPSVGPGQVWNGLTSIEEAADSVEKFRYIDGVKNRLRRTKGEFRGTIKAFTYPPAFFGDILHRKQPPGFGMSYRVGTGVNYRINLVYNVVAIPTSRTYAQRDSEPFSWAFTTNPIAMPDAQMSAHLIIDSSVAYPWTIADLEDILYGTEVTEPRLPTPQEVWNVIEENSLLLVVDHGDGTFSIIGPDDAITITGTTFEVNWPSVINLDAYNYQISSL